MIISSKVSIDKLRARPHLLISLLLVAATLAVFWRITGHEFIIYDDDRYVTANEVVQAGLTREGIRWAFFTRYNANWHPLTWISHMADCELYGLNPHGHHATSLILHTANVLLLFVLLSRLTNSPWRSGFVAALFAIHPLHVESVAWIAERKDVLSTFFWMLTMWAYVHYAERPILGRYLLVIALFALGLMAKPMLVTLPFVLLLLDYWPLRRLELAGAKTQDRAWAVFDLVWEKIPLFGLSAASSLVTYQAQQAGGSMAVFEKLPLTVRVANALVAYIGYIGKTVFPQGLAVLYPHPGDALPAWQVAGAGLLLASVSVLVIMAARRRPYLAVGWLWYLGTLVPVIGLIQVGDQAMADRYTYVPLIGLFLMAAWTVPDLSCDSYELCPKRDGPDRSGSPPPVSARRSTALAAIAVAIIAAFMACSWIQVGYWRNSILLFRHALEVTKDNYMMHTNLGVALGNEGLVDDAIREYRKAIRIQPDSIEPHNNLAVLLYRKGEYAEAWKEVHICQKYGFTPPQSFLDALSEQMPEPQK